MNKIEWHNEKRRINELIEWEKNPRYIKEEQFEKLKENITKYGFTNPPILNTDNKIIAGHMRCRAMVSLGRGNEEIAVRIPSRTLTEKEAEELAIRDNKNTGSWDFDILANEFEIDDLIDWGFSEIELTDIELIEDNEIGKSTSGTINDASTFAIMIGGWQWFISHKDGVHIEIANKLYNIFIKDIDNLNETKFKQKLIKFIEEL